METFIDSIIILYSKKGEELGWGDRWPASQPASQEDTRVRGGKSRVKRKETLEETDESASEHVQRALRKKQPGGVS